MSTKAAKPLQFSAVLSSLLALNWHSKQGQGRKHCVCGCALVAREKSVTGASSVLFIPHVTLSPALQRRSELGRQQAGEAAAGWWRRTFLCLGGMLHTACSLWLCSLWGPWRFECYLVWEPSVSEIENTFVLLNPAWGRADWKAQDPELVSAQFTWGFAAMEEEPTACRGECPFFHSGQVQVSVGHPSSWPWCTADRTTCLSFFLCPHRPVTASNTILFSILLGSSHSLLFPTGKQSSRPPAYN